MASTIEIFLCYAREDEADLLQLKKQLRVFQREELIRVWYDRNISPGEEWEKQVHAHLSMAQIVLLLISPDFMNSDYCYGIEMTEALKRHAEGDARVVPIIVRPVHWDRGPLGKLQALPTDGKPITSWHNSGDAFHDVAEGVRKVIGEFLCIQWVKTGKEHLHKHQYEDALIASAKAIDLAPHYEEAYHTQGDALYNLGRYQDALVSYGRVHSTEPFILLRRGQCLLHIRRYEDALAVNEEMIHLNKKDILAYAYKGYALLLLKRYEEALAICEQALRLDPKNVLVYYFTTSILTHLQRHQQALLVYEQALSLKSDNASIYLAKGDALSGLERYEEALAVYEQAKEYSPNDPWIYEHWGDTLYSLEQYEKALSLYEQAIHHDSGNATLYDKKAHILEKLAQQTYTIAKQLDYKDELQNDIVHPSVQTSFSKNLFTRLIPIGTLTHTEPVLSVAISPNGKLVATVGLDKTLNVWDLQREKLINRDTLSTVNLEPFVTFSPDGYLVITGVTARYDCAFATWNAYLVNALRCFPSGSTLSKPSSVTGPSSGLTRVTSRGGPPPPRERESGYLSGNCAVTSPDGQMLIGSYTQTDLLNPDADNPTERRFEASSKSLVGFWNLHDGKKQPDNQEPINSEQIISSLTISSAEQTLASGNEDATIVLWDMSTMRRKRTLTGHKKAIRCLAIDSNGQILVSGGKDLMIKVWELRSGRLLHTLEGHSKGIQILIISPDSRTLLSADEGTSICLWDLSQGTLLDRGELLQEKQPGTIRSAIVTFDRKLLIASVNDKTVKIWGNR